MSAPTREAVWAALVAQLTTMVAPTPVPSGKITAVSRVWRPWEDLAGTDVSQPILYIVQTENGYAEDKGSPALRSLSADLVLYCNRGSELTTEAGGVGQLDAILDAIDVALKPDPITGVNTLGGLVSHCWITGKAAIYEGTLGEQLIATLPVEILLNQDATSPPKHYFFDTGSLYITPVTQQDGQPANLSAPVRFANLKGVTIEARGELIISPSQLRHAIKMAKGKITINVRARFGTFDGVVMDQAFFETNAQSGATRYVEDELHTIGLPAPVFDEPWSYPLGLVAGNGPWVIGPNNDAGAGAVNVVTAAAPGLGAQSASFDHVVGAGSGKFTQIAASFTDQAVPYKYVWTIFGRAGRQTLRFTWMHGTDPTINPVAPTRWEFFYLPNGEINFNDATGFHGPIATVSDDVVHTVEVNVGAAGALTVYVDAVLAFTGTSKNVAGDFTVRGVTLGDFFNGAPETNTNEADFAQEGELLLYDMTTPIAITATVPTGGTWITNLGVSYRATGQPLTLVPAAPTAGQYSQPAPGSYLFSAADAGAVVAISYLYTVTTGTKIVIQNLFKGLAPTFQAILVGRYNDQQVTWVLEACASERFQLPTLLEQFTIMDFEFQAFADLAGNVGTISAG